MGFFSRKVRESLWKGRTQDLMLSRKGFKDANYRVLL